VSIERIRRSIIEEAKREAEEILAAASKEADGKVERARREILGEAERRLRRKRVELSEAKGRALIRRRAGYNMELLKRKNAIIERVFQRAMEKIRDLPEDEYLDMLRGWIEAVGSGGGGELAVNPRDAKLIDGSFLEGINRNRAPERRSSLAPEPIDTRGGFILRTGKFVIDQTLETVIDGLREEVVPEIAKELFGE